MVTKDVDYDDQIIALRNFSPKTDPADGRQFEQRIDDSCAALGCA